MTTRFEKTISSPLYLLDSLLGELHTDWYEWHKEKTADKGIRRFVSLADTAEEAQQRCDQLLAEAQMILDLPVFPWEEIQDIPRYSPGNAEETKKWFLSLLEILKRETANFVAGKWDKPREFEGVPRMVWKKVEFIDANGVKKNELTWVKESDPSQRWHIKDGKGEFVPCMPQ